MDVHMHLIIVHGSSETRSASNQSEMQLKKDALVQAKFGS